jgi:hypothetical protein
MNHQGTKTPREPISEASDAIAEQVVDAALKVHKTLGPGLLESVYEACLAHELKAVDQMLPVHTAQVLTYLKLAEKRLGLLINFNVPVLKSGIKRFAL